MALSERAWREPDQVTRLVDFGEDGGELEHRGTTEASDWRAVLEQALPPGLDPADYELAEAPRLTSMVEYDEDGETSRVRTVWWKVKVQRRVDLRPVFNPTEGEKDLLARISQKAVGAPQDATPPLAFVVNVADLQLGQADDGGVERTLERWREKVLPQLERRYEDMVTRYGPMPVWLVNNGDATEGCDGYYPNQLFTVQLTWREQVTLARRMWLDLVLRAFDWGASHVKLVAAPSNHGQAPVRKAGTHGPMTTDHDSSDLQLLDSLMDLLLMREDLEGRVSYEYPDTDRLDVVVELGERSFCWIHGHQARRGASPLAKAANWWAGQIVNRTAAGRADCLTVAHYHSLHLTTVSSRMLLMVPALCGTSAWWEQVTGEGSLPGVLTYVAVGDTDFPAPVTEVWVAWA